MDDGSQIFILTGHTAPIEGLAVTPDARILNVSPHLSQESGASGF
jgi:hypothetical protein